jgi:hypothetical protein
MAGLRDGLQRSRELYLPEHEEARDQAEASKTTKTSRTHSAALRVRNIGFSLGGSQSESAWKRRVSPGSVSPRVTIPTETTLRTTLLTRCALAHGLGGMLLSGVMTIIFLESGQKNWLWLILLSMALIGYSVGAYWCAGHLGRLDLSRWLIVGGDLALLALIWLLVGPSSLLYLLFPSLILLAALLSVRRDLLVTVALEGGLLMALSLTNLAGLPHLQLSVRPPLSLLLTLVGSLLCLGWMTGALLALLTRTERLGGAEHWNSAEVARVRIESDLRLRQLQDEITTIQDVVSRAVVGEMHSRVIIKEGELAPLAAKLNQLLSHQKKMAEESREHRRLERAVGELVALLEALHRGEHVGWPPPTGTSVDRILALMRAPLTPRATTKLPVSTAEEPSTPAALPSVPSDALPTRSDPVPEPVAPPAFLRDAGARGPEE